MDGGLLREAPEKESLVVLEGRVTIANCGCWVIRSYAQPDFILRCSCCPVHLKSGLDMLEKLVYLDKEGSVSASEEEEEQLWLT